MVDAERGKQYKENEEDLTDFWREWEKQIALLEELRELEITGLVEKHTGEQMKLHNMGGHPRVLIERVNKTEWNLEVVSPYFSKTTEEWRQGLLIKISQPDELDSTDYSPGVILSYSPDKELKIMGEQVTYQGNLPQDPAERIGLVDHALVAALQSPMSEKDIWSILHSNPPKQIQDPPTKQN